MMATYSLFHFPQGSTVTAFYSLRALYGRVGTVFSFYSADISERLFSPCHNVEEMAKKFPERVSVLDGVVYLKGPVLINHGAAGVYGVAGILSFGAAFLSGSLSYGVATLAAKFFGFKNEDKKTQQLIKAAALVTGAVAFCGSFAFFLSKLPTEPGIHLFNRSLTRLN